VGCVYQTISPGAVEPACPASFSHNIGTFYPAAASSYDDTRDCSACGCSAAPDGGRCSGGLLASSDVACAADAGAPYDLASLGCQKFSLSGSLPLSHVAGQFTLEAGVCGVTLAPHAVGGVQVTAAGQVVCCQ
jgi:hypothetical protein